MTDLRTAAQQALEALEKGVVYKASWIPACADAIIALRAALAEQAEPDSPERRCGGPGCDLKCCQPVGEPVLTVDALRVEFERRYRGNLGITRVEGGVYLSPAIETEWQQFVRKYTSPPQRKPVEWDGRCMVGHCNSPAGCENSGECRAGAATPQRKPLTEEEIDHVANNILTDDPVQWWRKLARAVEAAHGIKE